MNVLVKAEGKTYRLPVQRELDAEKFDRFQTINENGEVLVFPLDRGRPVIFRVSKLEYIGMQQE